jgi:drug/metabolite transporter (DMT)-like permease
LVPTLALLYLTIFGTLIAFASFFYLLKHTRLSTAMTLSFVTPMIALLIDAFFEKHNVLTPETYLGIAVVLIGVIISVVKKSEAPLV